MRIRLLQFALCVALVAAGGSVSAQTLPPPRVMPSEAPIAPPVLGLVMPPIGPSGPPLPLPPVFYRPSAYRWQYYGTNYSGFLRPLVIDAAPGAYYLYNGVPFPWVRNYPGEHTMPFARD